MKVVVDPVEHGVAGKVLHSAAGNGKTRCGIIGHYEWAFPYHRVLILEGTL